MNLRKFWTELTQKPAGRLVLFLIAGAVVLAILFMQRGPQPKPATAPVPAQATAARRMALNWLTGEVTQDEY